MAAGRRWTGLRGGVAWALGLSLSIGLSGCGGSGGGGARATTAAPATAPGVALSGRAVDAEGAPIAGAFVLLASKTTGEAPELDDPTPFFTDAEGRFTVRVEADAWDVYVVDGQGRLAQGTVDLRAGEAVALGDLVAIADEDAIARALEALVERGPEGVNASEDDGTGAGGGGPLPLGPGLPADLGGAR